jgi:hypothetical protein
MKNFMRGSLPGKNHLRSAVHYSRGFFSGILISQKLLFAAFAAEVKRLTVAIERHGVATGEIDTALRILNQSVICALEIAVGPAHLPLASPAEPGFGGAVDQDADYKIDEQSNEHSLIC